MEDRCGEFGARSGIRVRAALVLVSVVPDSDFDRNHDCLLASGVDAIARGNGCAERILGDGCRMAPLRDHATGIPTGRLGCEAAFRKRAVCCRNGRLRTGGSNRPFCLANLWRRVAVSDNDSAGCDWIWLVSETYARQKGRGLRAQLWNPFLKRCGGSVHPGS